MKTEQDSTNRCCSKILSAIEHASLNHYCIKRLYLDRRSIRELGDDVFQYLPHTDPLMFMGIEIFQND